MQDLKSNIQTYFGVVDEDELELVLSYFKPNTLKRGDFLVKQGRNCERLSFLAEGYIRIYKTEADKEVTQWISSPAYFVTELSSFLFSSPARFSIQAITECELYTIDKASYQQLKLHVPHWNELEKLFIAKCFTFLEDRIYSHLSMSAEERYLFFYKANTDLFNRVPLQYIASMLGITPETLSRLRKRHATFS